MARTALVLGGAESVFDDIVAARRLFEPDAYFVINDTIALWPERVDYAVTLHPGGLHYWLGQRVASGFSPPGQCWAHRNRARGGDKRAYPEVSFVLEDDAGSSGLFAVKVARKSGFARIVLCGVPMSPDGKHILRHAPWGSAITFRSAWLKHRKRLSPFVRSMSGWTRDTFGPPTIEWLNSP